MKRNSFLIFFHTATLFVFVGQIAFSQSEKLKATDKQATYIHYIFSGLGSNMGSFQPTISIQGTNFNYTYEQTSYWGERSKRIDKISSGDFRQSSIDSIIDLVKDLRDTLVYKSNFCIMSGGIHFLTIVNGSDTTEFELKNAFDNTALKIINIINEYLPPDKKLWTSEELIKEEKGCLIYLRERVESKKKSN